MAEDIVGSCAPLIEKAYEHLRQCGISMEDFEIDHVCYRTSTKEEYKSTISRLCEAGGGQVLVEGLIGGRPIAIVKLSSPIVVRRWSIPCVEVPCPKFGRPYASGLEHIELVIGGPDSSPLDSRQALEEFALRHPSVEFDRRAIDKHINADISLSLPGEEFSVKFHLCSLERVVELEKETNSVVPVPSDFF
jgi:predicted metalloenzyme YecM